MDEKKKREHLKKIPTRALLASIKKDLRRQIRASDKPLKEEVGSLMKREYDGIVLLSSI